MTFNLSSTTEFIRPGNSSIAQSLRMIVKASAPFHVAARQPCFSLVPINFADPALRTTSSTIPCNLMRRINTRNREQASPFRTNDLQKRFRAVLNASFQYRVISLACTADPICKSRFFRQEFPNRELRRPLNRNQSANRAFLGLGKFTRDSFFVSLTNARVIYSRIPSVRGGTRETRASI